MVLEILGIHTFYGSSHILFDLDLCVEDGEVIALMGRNGAGKTTTIFSVMGIIPPRAGKIKLFGEDITCKRPYLVARRGVGLVPEDRRIFSGLTVWENLKIAERKSDRNESNWTADTAFEFFPALRRFSNRSGKTLSGGEQQMLSISRALVGNPRILLLDEPTEGLAPVIVNLIEKIFFRIKGEGISMLLTEQQHLKFALALSDRVYIIDKGEIKYKGRSTEFDQDDGLKRKYLAV